MKQTKKLHPFMDLLKKARKQNAEFCEWLAMAEEAFNDGNAERAFEYALRAYEKTERTTLICRMMPAYFGRPNAFQTIEDAMLEVVPVFASIFIVRRRATRIVQRSISCQKSTFNCGRIWSRRSLKTAFCCLIIRPKA